eukprot:scaffold16579_cov58-Phaeocystis_antarctica.AAC.6
MREHASPKRSAWTRLGLGLERCADEHRGARAAVEHVLEQQGQLRVGKWHVGQLGLTRPLRNVAGEQRLDAPLQREEADVDVKSLLQPLALLVVLGPRDAGDLLAALRDDEGANLLARIGAR